jgi:hypothetical protein
MQQATSRGQEIAKTILRQLGGQRFIVMTGAKNFTSSANGLTFKVAGKYQDKRVTHIQILLEATDTYEVKALHCSKANVKVQGSHNMVYADQLQSIFTELTGLDTHL